MTERNPHWTMTGKNLYISLCFCCVSGHDDLMIQMPVSSRTDAWEMGPVPGIPMIPLTEYGL